MKKIVISAIAASFVATSLMAAPDSSVEVTSEFSDSNILTFGVGTMKTEIDGIKVADFGDSNDVFLTQKVSLASDDFSETFLKWKLGFTFNDNDNQDDVFHAGIGFGFSSIVTEDNENLGWFIMAMAEYYNGNDDQTLYTADMGINFKASEKGFWITPFVGMVADDQFDDIEGSFGAMLTGKVMENGFVTLKYSDSDYQDAITLSFSYAY